MPTLTDEMLEQQIKTSEGVIRYYEKWAKETRGKFPNTYKKFVSAERASRKIPSHKQYIKTANYLLN